MSGRKQAGFTIIEVLLYLGVVGLLFLIAFWGTNGQVDVFRFSDSVRNLDSFLEQQYSDVQNGINPRSDQYTCTASGSSPPAITQQSPGDGPVGAQPDCLLLGKMIIFNPGNGNVQVYYIVGQNVPYTSLTGDDITDIHNSHPTLSQVVTQTYQMDGGINFFQPSGFYPPSSLTEAFAFIRSPSSGNTLTFVFNNNEVNAGTAPGANLTSLLNQAHIDTNSGYCVEDTALITRYAMIQLGSNQANGNINISYNPTNPNGSGSSCVE